MRRGNHVSLILYVLLILLVMSNHAFAISTAANVKPEADFNSGDLKYQWHKLSSDEIEKRKEAIGIGKDEDYNIIISGHGTGLAAPTEDDLTSMIDVTFVDSVQASALPSSYRLDKTLYFPPVRDQGYQESDVSWAIAYYANTFLQARIHNWNDVSSGNSAHIMSPSWVYNKANRGVDEGSYYTSNVGLIESVGCASMGTMPYEVTDFLSWGDEHAWREAPLYRVGGMEVTASNNVDVIKSWLTDGYLVVFGINSDFPWYYFSSLDNTLSYSEYPGGNANHANTIVGYDDSISDIGTSEKGAFRVVNSWGSDWHDGGFYWITYHAMDKIFSGEPYAYRLKAKTLDLSPYNPTILATWRLSWAGSRDALIKIDLGNTNSPVQIRSPSWQVAEHDTHPFPNFLCLDITEFASNVSKGIRKFYLDISGGTTPSTVVSYRIEFYKNYKDNGPYFRSDEPKEIPIQTPALVKSNFVPIADFNYTLGTLRTEDIVQFSDNTTDFDGAAIKWAWKFGDGFISNEQNPKHRFSKIGGYTIELSIVDDDSNNVSTSKYIAILNTPPKVNVISPNGGEWYKGKVTIQANVLDIDAQTVDVKFYYVLNDTAYYIGSIKTSTGTCRIVWDTSPLTSPRVKIRVVGYDGADYSLPDESDSYFGVDNSRPRSPSPILPQSSVRTDSKPTFFWTTATDNGSGIASYTLELDNSPSFNSSNLRKVSPIRTTNYTLTEPLPSGKWYWRVFAQDNAGNISPPSETGEFISDQIKITDGDVNVKRANVDSIQLVWFKAVYDYDGTEFNGEKGILFVNNTAATWDNGNKRWELRISKSTVGRYSYVVSSVQEFQFDLRTINDVAGSQSLVFDRIDIELGGVSDPRIDVGKSTTVFFVLKYEYDSSFVSDGTIYINDTKATYDVALNRWEVLTSHTYVGDWIYSITGVTGNAHNITAINDVCGPQKAIWDSIIVAEKGVEDSRINYNSVGRVYFKLRSEYDNEPITSSSLTINNTSASWNNTGQYWYISYNLPSVGRRNFVVDSVNWDAFGITALDGGVASNSTYIIWDKLVVSYAGSYKKRINVNSYGKPMFSVRSEYDGSPIVSGTLTINGEHAEYNSTGHYWYVLYLSTSVGLNKFYVDSIRWDTYNITALNSGMTANTTSIIWDRINVTLSILDDRINIGDNASIGFTGVYEYDGTPWLGRIVLNDTTVKYLAGRWRFTVSSVEDRNYGLDAFYGNTITCIWDRVIISTFSVERDRIGVGKKALFNVSGVYEYDNTQWTGSYTLNDTDTKEVVGRYYYRLLKITDSKYGLETFIQKPQDLYVIFDKINVKQSVDTGQIGHVFVDLFSSYEYDGLPISNAKVSLDGQKCQNLGEGKYKIDIPTWATYLKTSYSVSLEGYDTISQNSETYVNGNLTLYVSLCVVIAVVTIGFAVILIRRRRMSSIRLNQQH